MSTDQKTEGSPTENQSRTAASTKSGFGIKLPPGVIVFTAPPQLASHRSVRGQRRSGRPKRIGEKEIADISGMMTKLGVGIEKSRVSVGTRPKTRSQATSEKKSTSLPIRRRVLVASRNPPAQIRFGANATSLLTTQGFIPTVQFRRCRGFWRTPFTPLERYDIEKVGKSDARMKVRHQSVSAMPEYANYSQEEIRLEDYLSGRKGPLAVSHYGPKFEPLEGVDTLTKNRVPINITTQHNCISAMWEYQNMSFEECRMEQYMPSYGWRDRARYSLSERELRQLAIAVDSTVFVFLEYSKKKGKVRFIGRLPDRPQNETHVGVEYDVCYGSGNGCYKGVKLFRTKEGHAEIVPLDSVLPEYLVDEEKATTLMQDKVKIGPDVDGTRSSESLDLDGPNKCAVCWANPVGMFFIPCGHVCCCESCAKSMKDCPICRKKIQKKHKAYLT